VSPPVDRAAGGELQELAEEHCPDWCQWLSGQELKQWQRFRVSSPDAFVRSRSQSAMQDRRPLSSRPCIELSCLRGLCCGRLCRNFRQCRDELLDVRCPQSCDAVITSSGGKLAIAAGCDVPETSGAAQWVDDRVQIRERRQSGFLPRLVDDHKDQPKPAQPSLFRQFQSAVRAGPGKPLRWDRRLRSHREPTSCFRWVRHCLSARRGGRRRCCSLRRCQSSRPPLQQTHLPVQASSLSRRPRRPPYPMRHIRPAADRQGSARHRPDWIRRLRSTRRC